MLSTKLLEYYENYLKSCSIIDDMRKIDNKKYRYQNFPECVSEYLIYTIEEGVERITESGDLMKNSKKIEVKCFSSKGPISFGPTESWDVIYFIDAINHPIITVYKCNIKNTDIEWQNIKINRKETYSDQIKSKRRPRICFSSLKPQLQFESVKKYNIRELLSVYKIADFCCGIGGIRLGFEQTRKVSCVFSNDIDKFCVKTYEANFDGNVNTTPIGLLKCSDIPDFDILLCGFPCQSFSIAGNKKGFDDTRGLVFFDLIRILETKKPKCFLLENVKNLKSHDKGKTFITIKSEIKRIGYYFKSKIMNTCDYANCPQNRERIYIVGFLSEIHAISFRFPKKLRLTKNINDFLENDIESKYIYDEKSSIFPVLQKIDKKYVCYQYRRGILRENKSGLCPTLMANLGLGGHNVPIIKDESCIRKLSPRECLNLQTFPKGFKTPCSDSQTYKQIGNSVSVKVIYRIAKEIFKVLK